MTLDENIESRPLIRSAFAGGALRGARVVKFAYLDEAGIGGEEWTIVAGVMIEPDLQWLGLKGYLADIAKSHLLPEDQEDCVFHAKDIWHGAKRFSRDKYSLSARKALLMDLASIPRLQGLPVFGGVVNNVEYAAGNPGKSKKDLAVEAHCMAYANCVCLIDTFMKRHCDDAELVTLVLENNAQARSSIRQSQRYLQSLALKEHLGDHPMVSFLPVEKVVDVPHFVEKDDSPILQVADVVSFILSRHVSGRPNTDDLFAAIRPQMVLALRDGSLDLGDLGQ